MKQDRIALLVIVALLVCVSILTGQQANVNPARVVATCATPPTVYPGVGQNAPLTVDTNGNLCAGVSVSANISTAGLAVALGAGTAGTQSGWAAAVYNTAGAPAYTEGTFNALSGDLTGALRVAASVSATVNTAGLATSVNQSTEIGHLATIAGAVSGTEIQADVLTLPNVTLNAGQTVNVNFLTASPNVTVSAALPAGTNNIGDVDVLTLPNVTLAAGQTVNVNFLTSAITVTDGAGALNTIVDSGTITSITNPVTITGTITGITNSVTINTAATGAVTVTCASGCSASSGVDLVSVRGASIPNLGSGALAVIGITSSGTTAVGGPVLIGALSGTASQSLSVNTTSGGLKVDVASVTAAATGTQTAANSDSIVCATDTLCATNLSRVGGTAVVAAVTAGVLTTAPGIVGVVAPSGLTDGTARSLSLDSSGNVRVNVVAGSSGNAAASATGAAVPASADYQGIRIGANLVGATGEAVSAANGQHVVIASGSGLTISSLPNVTVGTFPDNEPFNVAQLGGTAFVAGATAGTIPVAVVQATAPTGLTDGTWRGLSLDQTNAVRVNVVSGSVGNAAAGATGSSVPAQAGYTGVNVGGTLRGVTATASGPSYGMDVNVISGSGLSITVPNVTELSTIRGANIPNSGSGALAVIGITSSGTTAIGGPVLIGGLSGTASQSITVSPTRGGLNVTPAGYTSAVAWGSSVNLAVTNSAMITVAAGTRIVLHRANFLCGSTVSVAVTVSLGFATATLPTTGAGLVWAGMVTGASAFQGIQDGTGFPNVLGVGASDEDLRLTMTVPTGGACTLSLTYSTEPT